MSNAHFTYFKIENFKRFDSIELTDIGQFNLIVGDNNVGKTSLLEAMLVDEDDMPSVIFNYHRTLFNRGIDFSISKKFDGSGNILSIEYPEGSYLLYLLKDSSKPLKISVKTDRYITALSEGILGATVAKPTKDIILVFNKFNNDDALRGGPHQFKYTFLDSTKNFNIHQDELNNVYKNRYLPFIDLKGKSVEELFNEYNDNIALSRSLIRRLIGSLTVMISDLEEISILEVEGSKQLGFGIKDLDKVQLISTFGEGTKRVVEILIDIIKNKGKRLFIDEIDTGIHHSRMRSFLKTVFKLAKEHDVQLFMTTHSAECQQAFVEVFEEGEMAEMQNKVRSYTLIEDKSGKIKAQSFNYEQLQNALEIGFETRGGKRGW